MLRRVEVLRLAVVYSGDYLYSGLLRRVEACGGVEAERQGFPDTWHHSAMRLGQAKLVCLGGALGNLHRPRIRGAVGVCWCRAESRDGCTCPARAGFWWVGGATPHLGCHSACAAEGSSTVSEIEEVRTVSTFLVLSLRVCLEATHEGLACWLGDNRCALREQVARGVK